MSKHPTFGPLNNRKPTHTSETVGNTYGERRQKMGSEETSNWVQKGLQWGKDLFLGSGKKTSNIDNFSSSGDRYEGVRQSHFSSNPILEKKARLEEGYSVKAKTQQPSPDKYVGFLNSVIEYLDTSKKKV